MKKLSAKYTIAGCYLGSFTQAITANFIPLLFLTFHSDYGISLTLIGTLITVNFGTQLLTDLIASKIVDKIGYRPCLVAAELLSGGGLILIAVLPELLSVPVAGLYIASIVYAVGSGRIEVLVSPVVEACPTKNKKAAMGFLHSCYSWGQVIVIALSTLFFVLAGIDNWKILAFLWAIIPFADAVFFLFVPLYPLVKEGKGLTIKELLKTKTFWLFAILMMCAGSSEISVSQWASAFAEAGLGVSKTVGDLLGPCMFAVFMGTARVLYSVFGSRMNIRISLLIGAIGCGVGYLMCSFSPVPAIGLAGCAMVGLFVGIMWPGLLSFASEKIPKGGTAMFAFLALAGDVGCMAGPSAVGAVSDAFGGDLNIGLSVGLIFIAIMIGTLIFFRGKDSAEKRLLTNQKISEKSAILSSKSEIAAEESKEQEQDKTSYDVGGSAKINGDVK